MQRVPSCAYCFKPYAFKGSGRPVGQRIPRLLSCGHTFCDGCISKLAELHPGELFCPTCESRTALPGGKKQIKDLPTNLYILGILINNVRASIEKDVTKGELSDFHLDRSFSFVPSDTATGDDSADNGETICEECCTNIATSECQKCVAVFCKTCFTTVHSSSRTLRSHEQVPLGFNQISGLASNGCPTHDGKEIEFFDETDSKLVCSLCVVSPQCQGHEMKPITELCDSVKQQIQEGLDDVKKIHVKLQQSRGKLSCLFPEIKAECGEVVQQIKEHFQDLHTKLQAREVGLICEVKAAYCSENFLGDTGKEIIEKCKEFETLIQQSTTALSSPSILMNEGESLVLKLANVKEMPCILSQSAVHGLVAVSYSSEFPDAIDNYGSVVCEGSGLVLKKLSEEQEEALPKDEEVPTTCPERQDSMEEVPVSPRSGRSIMSLQPRQNLVYVTHIKNPCDFMVQHAADAERLENLMDAVNHYCEGAKNMSDMVKGTEIGDMVCAQYSKDRYWYRARIIGEQQQTSTPKSRFQQMPKVEVCFIDYGNTEVVPLNRLRKIKPEFTDIPELAMNCSLVDIVPPAQNEIWPPQSVKAFGSLTREKGLLMSVKRRIGGKLFVDLRSPDEEPTKDDDKPASVRDALVFLDVARFSTPASVGSVKPSFPVRSYKKAAMPVEGDMVEVLVTHVEDPDALYVMVDTDKQYADLMKIVSQMSSMYSVQKGSQWQIMWPYKGLLCAARYSGDKVWYRALVTGVVADQLVQVTYIDFGNSEELPFTEIRRIPDHMIQFPMQAIQCSLAAIKPIDEENGWSDECIAFLSDTCCLNRYRMKVLRADEDEPLSVVLCQIDAVQPTSVNRLLLTNLHASVTNPSDLEELQSESAADGEEISSLGDDSPEIKDWSSCGNETEPDSPGESPQQKKVLFHQMLRYKPVEYPTKAKFQFSVTYVDKDCTIFGYQAEKSDHSLPELMKLVQNVCTNDISTSVTQEQLSINQPCCAEFSEDNLWYRAEVVGFPTQSTVLVDYVDFGNREEIPLASIKLDAAFLDIPKQCLSLGLEGLPQTPEVQVKVSKYLTRLLIGQTCVAVIDKKSLLPGSLKCVQLDLPDGSNILDVVKEMMVKDGPSKGARQPKSGKSKGISLISMKSSPERSLICDTYLPEKGITFDVTVTQVDKPNVVFLQRIPPTEDDPGFADSSDPTTHIANDHLSQLEHISEKINTPNYFEGKPGIKNVWEGMLCCAQYTQDEQWYRAQILEVESADPLQVKVLYIDYGTSEVIGLDRVKSFPGELLSLPKQAFQCSINGLDASTDEESSSESTLKAVDSLIKAVAGKKLICKVVEFGSPVVVELFERVFNEESYEDVFLPQRLSELELMMEMSALDVDDDQLGDNMGDNGSSGVDSDNDDDNADEDDNDIDHNREICGQNILVSHPQLITPAQFCLKKDVSEDP